MQSGTSLDGIDAVLVAIAGQRAELAAAVCIPYEDDVRERVRIALETPARVGVRELALLDARIGRAFGEAAASLLASAGVAHREVRAIGSHGQTVQHGPDAEPPFTFQIGDPARIAERTGLPVVAHFRTRDVAAGGQGAPLAPALHAALLREPGEARAVLNLGGVANVTLLPADPAAPVTGFDTGPANALSDAWARRELGRPFDDEGAWAAGGEVRDELLRALLAHPYFAAAPPKSTGPETFNLAWVLARPETMQTAPRDVQATLVELTARTVADALSRHAPDCERLLVCGGGVRNRHLLARLATHCRSVPVVSTARYGLDPAWVEATLFAWLAQRYLASEAGNLPTVTGAAGLRVLGALYAP